MKKTIMTLLITLVFSFAFADGFKVSVAGSKDGGFMPSQIFNGFGCTGGNVSPEVVWENPPAGTKSFALTVYDPDAPTGSGWWHWVVTDIPSDARKIAEGAGSGKAPLPKGAVQSGTDFGFAGYGGPCPPPGPAHRYIFTLYALKAEKLGVDSKATGALAGFMINANAIGKTETILRYGR